jgi:hypothetical protein
MHHTYKMDIFPLQLLGKWTILQCAQDVNNVRVIAAASFAVEESPCSHGAEMPVVFVPSETIS